MLNRRFSHSRGDIHTPTSPVPETGSEAVRRGIYSEIIHQSRQMTSVQGASPILLREDQAGTASKFLHIKQQLDSLGGEGNIMGDPSLRLRDMPDRNVRLQINVRPPGVSDVAAAHARETQEKKRIPNRPPIISIPDQRQTQRQRGRNGGTYDGQVDQQYPEI